MTETIDRRRLRAVLALIVGLATLGFMPPIATASTGGVAAAHRHIRTERAWTRAAGGIRPMSCSVPRKPKLGSRVLRRGMSGPLVCLVNQTLARMGRHVTPSARFTKRTERAVRKFQASHGLHVDGIVGPATFSLLVGGDEGAPTDGDPGGAEETPSSIPEYVFPLETVTYVGRVDRGQDMESTVHGKFLAIGDGVIQSGAVDFPGVTLKLLTGPAAGRTVFYGHTHKSFVTAGQVVQAGDALGLVGHQGRSYDGGTTHIEVGFLTEDGRVAPVTGPHHWAETGADMHRLLHRIRPDLIGDGDGIDGNGVTTPLGR